MIFESKTAARWCAIGALLAASAVALGAFGAHILEDWLVGRVADPLKSLEYWGTGNRYMMYHSFAVMFVSLAAQRVGSTKLIWICNTFFVAGIVLFSGCLSLMALTDFKKLGMIVPLGGLAYIIGWLVFAGSLLLNSTAIVEKGE